MISLLKVMNRETYDNETMTAYLLGNLPEAEAEQFDELSFTDPKFALQLNTAEKDLVDSFVQGELSGAKLKDFNSFYLASPIRREKVEFAKCLQVYAAKNLQEISSVEDVKRQHGLSNLFSAFNIFAKLRNFWQFGFAASALLFMFLCGWLWLENNRLREQSKDLQARREALSESEKDLQKQFETKNTENNETANELAKVREEREQLAAELKKEKSQQLIAEQKKKPEQPAEVKQPTLPPTKISIASFILAPSLRGINQIQKVNFPAKINFLAMRVELESDDYPLYRVELVNQTNNKIIWQSGKLKATGANKVLNIRFPAKLVKPQIYSLEVSGIKAGGAPENVSSYPFKVVPQ